MKCERGIIAQALEDMANEPWEPDEPGNPATWGGKRPGAGRKAGQGLFAGGRSPIGKQPRQRVSATIDTEIIAELDRFCRANNVSRSQAINTLLDAALRAPDE